WAAVNVSKHVSDFCGDPQDVVNRQTLPRFTRIGDEVFERSAGQVASGHEGCFAFGPPLEHGRDVRMITEMAEDSCFPGIEGLPARHNLIVGSEEVESYQAVKVPIVCEVDLLSLPGPKKLPNLIPSVFQDFSWPQCCAHHVPGIPALRLWPVSPSSFASVRIIKC